MMQKPKSAAILIGSPKGPNSNSNSLGTYLSDKLNQKGIPSEKVYICQIQNSNKKMTDLLKLIDESYLIVFAFPLYVDSLHSHAIKTLELIAEHEASKAEKSKKIFVAIANSGFPEAVHNSTALNVCRIFANKVGYIWAGGLAMGGGELIGERPLAELGGMVRNQTKALDMVADALATGEPIPEKAFTLMSKLGFPKFLYIWTGNRGWKKEAKKHIEIREMYNQPYK
jgi:hypothetical protein